MSNQYHYYGYQPVGGMPAQPQTPGQHQGQGQGQGVAPGGYPSDGQAGFYRAPAPAAHDPYGDYRAYSAYPGAQSQAQTPFFNFGSDRFVKGVLIGAAAAYLLTNESVQRSAIKGVVKAWSMLQGGVAEIKERFHDAEAEIRAAESDPGV